ncbi:hypothetical protein BRADI_2g11405v3 [Brachypodium distachyon]|uniref:Uncharacterized protein n=1 Tax=Brachypodium distachyon TaxID=15368 RepID=A0A2K2D800_BRADI|nr:hypothetical protein BRADI_2g11405v3 [Brachypodium distachyon]
MLRREGLLQSRKGGLVVTGDGEELDLSTFVRSPEGIAEHMKEAVDRGQIRRVRAEENSGIICVEGDTRTSEPRTGRSTPCSATCD